MMPFCVAGKEQAEHEPTVCPGEGSSIVGGVNRSMNRRSRGALSPSPPNTVRTHPDTALCFRPPRTGKALTNWYEVSKAHRVVRDGAPALGGEVIGMGLGHPGVGRASEGPTATALPVGRGWRRWNQACHRGTWREDGTQWTKFGTEEVQIGCKDKVFLCEDSGAMEEAAL